MKPRRIVRGEKVTTGLVLTRDLAGLPKGRILSDDDVRALESSSWSELEALELESSDVHEEAAGQRLAPLAATEEMAAHQSVSDRVLGRPASTRS